MVNYAGLNTFSKIVGSVQATDPGVNHDKDSAWQVGDLYTNSVTGNVFECVSNASGAAVWRVINVGAAFSGCVGRLIGANFNVTTDNIIPLLLPTVSKFRLTKITVTNASVSLTTAAGGVYTAAAKGGTVVVLAAQAYTALTAATLALDLTPVAAVYNTPFVNATQLFLNLTTAQGAPATADVFVYGDIMA